MARGHHHKRFRRLDGPPEDDGWPAGARPHDARRPFPFAARTFLPAPTCRVLRPFYSMHQLRLHRDQFPFGDRNMDRRPVQMHPFWKDVMDASVSVERARDWSTALEDREAARSGVRLSEARQAVAQRVKVSAGTLENLRKRRLKAIAVHLYERLRGGVIRELQAEMMRLEHETKVRHHRRSFARPRVHASCRKDLDLRFVKH